MKYRRDLFLFLTCLLLAFLFTMAGQRQSDEAMPGSPRKFCVSTFWPTAIPTKISS